MVDIYIYIYVYMKGKERKGISDLGIRRLVCCLFFVPLEYKSRDLRSYFLVFLLFLPLYMHLFRYLEGYWRFSKVTGLCDSN